MFHSDIIKAGNSQTPAIVSSAFSSSLAQRIGAARQAFSTRNVALSDAVRLKRRGVRPAAGDVVLAEVVRIGQHPRIENLAGRRGQLYVGDEVIVAYGNRYAPDQFEAFVPETLAPCHLAAGGGIAADVMVRHGKMKAPTELRPIGLLARADGRVLNLADYALAPACEAAPMPTAIAVLGSSMNAGKTTSAAAIIHGLTRAGLRVGAAKLTGTGSGGDLWAMRDAGARRVADFSDAGHASTFLLPADVVIAQARTLLASFGAADYDVVIVEIADGLLQRETAMLLEAARDAAWFRSVVFAAGDAMSAAFGTSLLAQIGLPACAVTGVISASPLASREAEANTGLPTLTLPMLRDPVAITKMLFQEGASLRNAA